MVLSQYLLIFIVIFFLEQRINKVECFRRDLCKFNNERKILDCSNRNLTEIPDHLFSTNYTKINLDNNLFVCDCNISWFLDAINTDNRHRILNLENLTCCWPGNHRKQYLVQLSREDVCLTTTERAPSVKTVNVSTTMKPNASESDPCQPDMPRCDPDTEVCERNKQSYDCHCKQGFKRNSKSGLCEAINYCAGNNTCSNLAQCINEIGSYKCICKSGYVGDGKHCKDIDECKDKQSNDCHKHAVCINQDGGYKCRCRSGYEQKKDGKLCVRNDNISSKTLLMAGIIAGVPFLTCVTVTILLCRRCLRRKRERQAAYSPENPPNDDIIPPDNQQLISGGDSFYEESIPMKGLPPSESAWSEWPDYDESRDDSDSD